MDLNPEEQAFVARLADHYAPPAMTPARRAAFARRLAGRLVRRSPWRVVVPAMAAVAAAALVWLAVPWSTGPTSSPGGVPEQVVTATGEPSQGEAAVFAAYDWFTSSTTPDAADLGEGDALPEDYQAISEFFL
jgi:ferric-dicitrate binding protein FerR (iron transport regulator)